MVVDSRLCVPATLGLCLQWGVTGRDQVENRSWEGWLGGGCGAVGRRACEAPQLRYKKPKVI